MSYRSEFAHYLECYDEVKRIEEHHKLHTDADGRDFPPVMGTVVRRACRIVLISGSRHFHMPQSCHQRT